MAEVEAVVDTGAATLVIPETLRVRLGLEIEDTGAVMLAGAHGDNWARYARGLRRGQQQGKIALT